MLFTRTLSRNETVVHVWKQRAQEGLSQPPTSQVMVKKIVRAVEMNKKLL